MTPKTSAPKTTKSTKSKASAPAVAISVGDDLEQHREPDLRVRLVGVEYDIYLPKTASAIALARSVKIDKKGKPKLDKGNEAEAVQALYDWIDAIFGTEQGNDVRARLEAANDSLDFQHINELLERVTEYARGEESEDPTS